MAKIRRLPGGDGAAASSETEGPPRDAHPDPLARYVPGAVRGEPEAIDVLLRTVGPSLLRAVRGALGDPHPDLEDVVQDSMLRFLRALESFRGESSVLHFAIRIAVRRATDYRRQARARGHLAEKLTHIEHVRGSAGTTSTPETLGDSVLRALLDELSDVQIETLLMRVVFDYSIAEIAQATGVPVNTVRSRLLLAKKALRARIQGDQVLANLLGGDGA